MKDRTIKIRTIFARFYYYLSCHRYLFFKAHKKYKQEIIIDVVNNKGEISFSLYDSENNVISSLDNPLTNQYVFPLEKGKKYKIVTLAKKACGSHKFLKKTYLIDEQ